MKKVVPQTSEVTIQKNFEQDLKYIKNEIISLQNNGKYCKYSRILHAVASYDMDKKQVIGYWKQQYKKYPQYLQIILDEVENLLKHNLTPNNNMIDLVKKSKDTDKEKSKIISLLK